MAVLISGHPVQKSNPRMRLKSALFAQDGHFYKTGACYWFPRADVHYFFFTVFELFN